MIEKALVLFSWLLQGYLLPGLIAGPAFIIWGVSKTDDAARGSSFWFRLIILPGSILLWPIVLRSWLSKKSAS